MESLGLYIHIPFCRQKCAYCDFYSLPKPELRGRYQAALLQDLSRWAVKAGQYPVDSIYFGGGTPTFYGCERLAELMRKIREQYHLTEACEITGEGNPDSVTEEGMRLLRSAGFNRISLGVQSGNDGELRAIGRIHTWAQVRAAVAACRAAGFENLSLDLIYGLPGQSMDSWMESLKKAAGLGVSHLSCYGLKAEEGTPLFDRVQQGECLPDDDEQAEFYLAAVEYLAENGYRQYEISNFALPGCASRHNLRYWKLQPYLGFGPGAHSDFEGRRFSTIRSLRDYIGIQNSDSSGDVYDTCETISADERAREYLMLSMRLSEGVDLQQYALRYGMDPEPVRKKLASFARYGWSSCTGGNWHLTPKGFLVSNALIGQVLECQNAQKPTGYNKSIMPKSTKND